MNRTEFVTALREFAKGSYAYVRDYERLLAIALADHVESLTIPYSDESYWRIYDHILGIIGHAMHKLREINLSDEELAMHMRNVLRETTGSDVLVERADKFLRPDWHLINARFMMFANEVYDRGGLYQKIRESSSWTMHHKFGRTKLSSAITSGRIMLTFARSVREDSLDMVTFICDDGDPHGISGGMTHRAANTVTILDMIDEVRIRWARESADYKESDKVYLA